jgi:hypothetical protein
MKTTYESFGIQCGKGWAGLYGPLIDLCLQRGIVVNQVKEKFGGLRFYVGGPGNDSLNDIIRAAEAESFHTCEQCGESGCSWKDGEVVYKAITKSDAGWLRTLCEPCRTTFEAKRRAEEEGLRKRYGN